MEDSASVTLRFACGALGSLLCSDCVPSRWSNEADTGENPFYYQAGGACYLFFGTEGSLTFPGLSVIQYPDPRRVGWQHPLTDFRLTVEDKDPLVAQMEHFARVVRGIDAPRTSGEDGLRTLAATRAVLEASISGHPVDLTV